MASSQMISRYNARYFCTISRATWVDENRVSLDFEVVGDMTLGALQDPSKSSLSWQGGGKRADSHNFVTYDRLRRIAGSLSYDGVPRDRDLTFTFGTGGYSSCRVSEAGPAARRPEVLAQERQAVSLSTGVRQAVSLSTGVSRYNTQYYCTVRRAYFHRGVLCVEFEVVGNMSMGSLQDPSSSKVTWRRVDVLSSGSVFSDSFFSSQSHCTTVSTSRTELAENDRSCRIVGKMEYLGVPEDAAISFTFGQGGYTRVVLSYGPVEDAAAAADFAPSPSAPPAAAVEMVFIPGAPPAADLASENIAEVGSAASAEERGLCVVCTDARADAMFLHGSTGHTACCMPCAEEIQRRRGACPVCRQRFSAVIRNFSA